MEILQKFKSRPSVLEEKKEILIKLSNSKFMDKTSLDLILKWCIHNNDLVQNIFFLIIITFLLRDCFSNL